MLLVCELNPLQSARVQRDSGVTLSTLWLSSPGQEAETQMVLPMEDGTPDGHRACL